MLGVTRLQQWKGRITSRELAERFEMTESMADILRRHHLSWLGHVARMEDSRMPKQLLFGELEKKRPKHGPRRRWKDLAVMDVQAAGIDREWFVVAQDRKSWAHVCKQVFLENIGGSCAANSSCSPDHAFECQCGRTFRRQGDLT